MKRLTRSAGFTMHEVIVTAAILTMISAAVFTGAVTLHRSVTAADDFAIAKADQTRLSDYLAMDLRRAVEVESGPAEVAGATETLIARLKMPDYYVPQTDPPQARTPHIVEHQVQYGDPSTPSEELAVVTYIKRGSSIFRKERDLPERQIATNVEDFKIKIQDLGKVVNTEITFQPNFSRKPTDAMRTATTVYNTTLLRNTRKDVK